MARSLPAERPSGQPSRGQAENNDNRDCGRKCSQCHVSHGIAGVCHLSYLRASRKVVIGAAKQPRARHSERVATWHGFEPLRFESEGAHLARDLVLLFPRQAADGLNRLIENLAHGCNISGRQRHRCSARHRPYAACTAWHAVALRQLAVVSEARGGLDWPSSPVHPEGSRRRDAARLQPRLHHASWSPIGSLRMRLPVAAKMALHSAGANGGTPGSPTPLGGTLMPCSTMWVCVTFGDSSMRTSG
jgi:hypothetical protein